MVPFGALLCPSSHPQLVWSVLAAFKCFICTCSCNSTFISYATENASPCGSEVEERVDVTVACVSGTREQYIFHLLKAHWIILIGRSFWKLPASVYSSTDFSTPASHQLFSLRNSFYDISVYSMLESFLLVFFLPVTPAEGLSCFLLVWTGGKQVKICFVSGVFACERLNSLDRV